MSKAKVYEMAIYFIFFQTKKEKTVQCKEETFKTTSVEKALSMKNVLLTQT